MTITEKLELLDLIFKKKIDMQVLISCLESDTAGVDDYNYSITAFGEDIMYLDAYEYYLLKRYYNDN